MNKLVILAGLGLALVLGAWAPLSTTQDEAAAYQPQSMPQHDFLASRVGDWTADLTFHGPENFPPMRARESIRMFGFHLVSEFHGEFMGEAFEGRSTMGYDPVREHFAGTWIDTMTPSMAVMQGDWDPEAQTLTMHYSAPNMTGELERMKTVQHHIDANNHTYKSYVVSEDGERLQMEIVYKRRPAGSR